MSIDQRAVPATQRPPLPDGRPETWVHLADCPMPPEGAAHLRRELAEYPFRGQALRLLEENVKFSHLFAGLWAATRRTPRGLVVVFANDAADARERVYAWANSLPPDERSRTLVRHAEDPNEERETFI